MMNTEAHYLHAELDKYDGTCLLCVIELARQERVKTMVGATVHVKTPACIVCGRISVLEVSKAGFDLWQSGMVIQKAFPNMTVDEREVLMSGIHPDCWDTMFKGKNGEEGEES